MPVQFPLRLVDRRMLAPTIGHYVLARDDGQPLDFIYSVVDEALVCTGRSAVFH